MAVMRNVLLWGSRNRWLEQQFRRRRFARRAVSRFMPGEDLESALGAAHELQQLGITAILTRLGENVRSIDEIQGVIEHYLGVIDAVHAAGLDAHVSIKLTQLGLDIDRAAAFENLNVLLEHTSRREGFLWIDMEQSSCVDATLDVYRRARDRNIRIGVCLQAYLYRTADDLEDLLDRDGTIRLVKGAYNEPPDVAFRHKRDVDRNYLTLACRLLDHPAIGPTRHALGTHDLRLLRQLADQTGHPSGTDCPYEVDMLYGIRAEEQRRLVAAGLPVRVLVSYGESWFPWYMRRLAERPANVGFVLRSMLAG